MNEIVLEAGWTTITVADDVYSMSVSGGIAAAVIESRGTTVSIEGSLYELLTVFKEATDKLEKLVG